MLIKLSAALYFQRETFPTSENVLGVYIVSISPAPSLHKLQIKKWCQQHHKPKTVLIKTYKGEGGQRFKAIYGAFTISCFGQ